MALRASTIVCFKYRTGTLIASDETLLLGSMLIPQSIKIYQITSDCTIGISGDYADARNFIDIVTNEITEDPRTVDIRTIYSISQRILYNFRSKNEKLNIEVVISGLQSNLQNSSDIRDKIPFVGMVTEKGNLWTGDSAFTGIATQLLKSNFNNYDYMNYDINQAIDLMKASMRVLFYRDALSSNKIIIGIQDIDELQQFRIITLDNDWSLGVLENEEVAVV